MKQDSKEGVQQDALVVTGVGLVSPVGHDSVSAPAAIRAGIARFGKVPLFLTPTGAGASGAMAYGVTDDRSGSDRLLAMAIPALREALYRAEEFFDDLDLSRSRCLLSLGAPECPRYEEFGAEDLQTLFDEADAGPLLGRVEVIRDGHAGGILALQKADVWLRDGTADCCVVGGVDSLIELPALDWLHKTGRLKTDDHPEGFMPGEAAAFLVLERASRARNRGAPALAEIVAPAFGREEAHLFSTAPLQGVGLTTVLRQTLKAAGSAVSGILCDLNGEYQRVKEWSLSMARVFAGSVSVPELWHPAQSIGDVGAASVPVLAAIGVAALRRNYFAGSTLLVWASSDSGGRGSAVLRAPGGAVGAA